MPFSRVFQHLLPTGAAWRITIAKTLRSFFEGLTEAPDEAREFIDDVHGDAFPATTRELAEWEKQFGLDATGNEAARRVALAAAWAAQGGQSPRYLQDMVQAAGFTTLFIHEWWSSGPDPYVARDPRDYTTQPLIGSVQCTGDIFRLAGQPQCTGYDGNGIPLDGQPQCNAFLANNPGYLVNKDLTPRAPPRVPDDPDYWPYFLYWGGETFPDPVSIPLEQRDALEKLVLKLCPTQQWLVMLVNYEAGAGIFSDEFDFTFN
jgi:hypothetical protein